MIKIKYPWDIEEEKEEKTSIIKFDWDKPVESAIEPTQFGIGAKAEMGVTLPKIEPTPLFQDPKMMELHRINFESFRLWFKELKESKDKIAFLKGEGQSLELKELRKQYKDKAPYLYEKSEQWIENVSMIAVGVGMAWQLVNVAVTSGFKVKDKVMSAEELKMVLSRARAAYVAETGKFKATLSDNDFAVMKQLNVFFKTSGRGTAAREMLEKIVEKTGGLSFPQQVNIFGGKLYSGIPIDEMVKSIASAGRLTQDIINQLKVMNPVDTGLVFQQLSMIAPGIASKVASEFVDLMPQKITKIPKAGEEMTPEELEAFERLKAAEIIPKEEVEPTKEELEKIEKIEKGEIRPYAISKETGRPMTKEELIEKVKERGVKPMGTKEFGYPPESYKFTGEYSEQFQGYYKATRNKRIVYAPIYENKEGKIVTDMEQATTIKPSEAIIEKPIEKPEIKHVELKPGEKVTREYLDKVMGLEKPITPKEKFMAKMEERIVKEVPEKIEPEPTPEEIKTVFMEEGNLETTVENRELFYEKYNNAYMETKEGYDKLLEEQIKNLKEEGFKGVDKGGVKRDAEGYVIGKIPAVSRNPKWYRDFYEINKKAPTNKDLKEIAIEQLSKGHLEDYGQVPSSEIFIKLEAQLDNYEAILSDIKDGDYSFETPKNIEKLNEKLKEMKKENKKLIKDYEEELITLRTEKKEKFKEIYEEVEAREKIGIEVGIKKGVKEAITGKKLKGLSEEEIKQGNRLMGQINKIVNQKGLSDKEYTALKSKYGYSPHLATKTKRMSIPQLEAVLKAVNRARPKVVEHKHVITPKTEKKIQSLKENLIGKLQMSEEKYQEVLKDVGVYKEPKYIDGKHFITETKGKDIIYRLIDEANILRSTLPYHKAVEEHPIIKKFIDREKAIIGRYRDRIIKDPREWNSMRVYAQKIEEITGAPAYRLYQDLIDVSLENKEKLGLFIRDFEPNKKLMKDLEALKRVTDYIGSKSTLKDKPAYPKDITSEEIKLAKKVEDMLIDYRARSRTQKFLDNVDHPEDMPQYIEFKKEIDKAKDIYESKGYDDLVEYMKTQVWGIIRNGYDPDQVWSPKIRMYKPDPQTFGKHNIKVRTDIEYHEQDRNIIERLFTYKKSMDNLVEMRPKVRAFITLMDQNLDKFKEPRKVQEVIEVFLRELKGYNKPEGLIERILNRAYAQAMQTIIMPSLVMFGRNCLQNLAFGYDKTIIIDPRNKKLSEGRIKYLNTYISQLQSMKVDWFMVGEKPLGGKIGTFLIKMVNKVGVYPYSDEGNRHLGFWGKINQVDRGFKGVDANSTEKQINKAMRGAKFDDIEITERIMALEILAKDGYEAMAKYVSRCYVADTEFQYNRAERSPMEMGRGKWLSNLMLFPRSYWEMLLKMGNKIKRGNVGQKARAFKVLVSIIVGGLIVGEGYKKVTGRRQNPYNPLKLLAYEPGGLAIGTVEAFSDVITNTILVLNGDERAATTLATAIPQLSDMMIPFYDYTLRAIEATVPMTYRGQHVNKRIDVLALRVLRKLTTDRMRELGWNVKGYKPSAKGYYVERNFYQKLQYIIAGAGVDIGIKEKLKGKPVPSVKYEWEKTKIETKKVIKFDWD